MTDAQKSRFDYQSWIKILFPILGPWILNCGTVPLHTKCLRIIFFSVKQKMANSWWIPFFYCLKFQMCFNNMGRIRIRNYKKSYPDLECHSGLPTRWARGPTCGLYCRLCTGTQVLASSTLSAGTFSSEKSTCGKKCQSAPGQNSYTVVQQDRTCSIEVFYFNLS